MNMKYLGIKEGASQEEIKNRFSFLTLAFHPDSFRNEEHKLAANAALIEIIQAKETLISYWNNYGCAKPVNSSADPAKKEEVKEFSIDISNDPAKVQWTFEKRKFDDKNQYRIKRDGLTQGWVFIEDNSPDKTIVRLEKHCSSKYVTPDFVETKVKMLCELLKEFR